MADLPAFMPVSDLETALGVPVGSLADLDLARANKALSDVSAVVRVKAVRSWTTDTVPQAAKVIALAIAKRVYENPSNYTSESVGDYSWQGLQSVVGLMPSDEETAIIRAAAMQADAALGGWSGVGSVGTPSAYVPSPGHRVWWVNGKRIWER